ncbi:hypothetical protein E2562_033220 [Oryza meyeriana var. granulata]|uniref:Uncharacterized protein n=1 Tax=Oryza meyeriana var. granulata TaxID=110450 RepID=A0A6G1BPF5_9ORYZ|nr:hypothetical protein E2562_033220 [Oryza meyeriana var. granulata]
MSIFQEMRQKLVATPNLQPQLPKTSGNVGPGAAAKMHPLKEQYLLAHMHSGHCRMAVNILKYVDRPLYNSLQGQDPAQVSTAMANLRTQYEARYPGRHSATTMAKQILGLAALVYWEKKKGKRYNEVQSVGG